MTWKCENGHVWDTKFNVVKNGRWCPYCVGQIKHTIEDAINIAHKNGGECLSKEYIGANEKLQWMCENKHTWFAIFTSVRRGSWCPTCMSSKKQCLLHDIIKNILTDKDILSRYRKLECLKLSQYKYMEIDIWVPELKLAIEYDGEQHFRPVRFGGMSEEDANDNFIKQRERDSTKDNLIKQNMQEVAYFIRFRYDEELSKEYVMNKLIELGVSI
jgi:hypothetical protein